MCQENYNSTVTISDGTHMKVKFELCKGWPKDGNLTIVPPGGYSISKDAAASGSGVTGGLSVLVNDENITIRRDGSGDAIEENSDGHAVEIEITGVIKAPVPMAPYRGNSADFTHTISRQCTAPPMTGQCLIVPLVLLQHQQRPLPLLLCTPIPPPSSHTHSFFHPPPSSLPLFLFLFLFLSLSSDGLELGLFILDNSIQLKIWY